MYRYSGGRQTYYPPPRNYDAESSPLVSRSRNPSIGPQLRSASGAFGERRAEDLLTEEQRRRLALSLERLDAAPGPEPALRLVAQEVNTYFAFQACKVLQRLAKRFGASLAPPRGSASVGVGGNVRGPDARLVRLAARCGETMGAADGVSVSRCLWGLQRLSIIDTNVLSAAAERIPAIIYDCGPITMATIWNSFEVIGYEPDDCLAKMSDAVLGRLQECEPPEVSIVLHAAALLNFSARDRLISALVARAREAEGTFSVRHLSVCFHAAARVGLRDEVLGELLAERFLRGFGDADTLAMTSFVYACGLIVYRNEALLERAAQFMEQSLALGHRKLTSQQVANFVYAFGKLSFAPVSALRAAADDAVADMQRYSNQELSNLAYGFGLLKFKHDNFLARLANHLTGEGRLETLDAQSIVSIVYAFALIGFCHHNTLRALGDKCIPKLKDFKPEEFSIMVYSLGVLNFRHHDLLREIVLHAPAVLPRFSTQNLSNLLHGLGLVTYDRDDAFVRLVASQLASRIPECTPQDIANPLTALMRVSVRHDELLRAIAHHVTASTTASSVHILKFTTQELANTVYCFDALQVFDKRLFELVAEETEKRLHEFIPQEVANVIWAFAKQSFGSLEWFERVLARCVPHAERPPRGNNSHALSTDWLAEDLEKPLGALWPVRSQLPSFARLERAFRSKYFDQITEFLKALTPPDDRPPPAKYQTDFAAWDLYQVGPLFTQELFEKLGIERIMPETRPVRELTHHYIGSACDDSLFSKFGDKMLLTVLPAARWVSSYLRYSIRLAGSEAAAVEGEHVVEAAHPKEDDNDSQRRLAAESWREPVELGCTTKVGAFRPVLLSTFLGNMRHRHTELIALDAVVSIVLKEIREGRWQWKADFWRHLEGEVTLLVPHTPCLSCVGAFAQLRRWSPNLCIRVAYEDWREWRQRLLVECASRSSVCQSPSRR